MHFMHCDQAQINLYTESSLATTTVHSNSSQYSQVNTRIYIKYSTPYDIH